MFSGWKFSLGWLGSTMKSLPVIPVDGSPVGGKDGVVKSFLLGGIHQVESVREIFRLQRVGLLLHLLQVILVSFLVILVLGVVLVWHPAHNIIQDIHCVLHLLLHVWPVLQVQDDPLVGHRVLHWAGGSAWQISNISGHCEISCRSESSNK